jgi:hypothetical protein
MRRVVLTIIEAPRICHESPASNPASITISVIQVKDAQEVSCLVSDHSDSTNLAAGSAPDGRTDMVVINLDTIIGTIG